MKLNKSVFDFEKEGVAVFVPVILEEFEGEDYYSPEDCRKIESVIRQFFPNHYKLNLSKGERE